MSVDSPVLVKKKNKKNKIKISVTDRIINFITYVVYSIFAFVCAYPFYYIFINTISKQFEREGQGYNMAQGSAFY